MIAAAIRPTPPHIGRLFAIVVVATGAARLIAGCAAATPDRAGRAFDVAGHSVALAECRAEGKDAGSYAVYGRCADGVDRKFGLTDDGGVK